jgi:hypothetical protein
MALYTVGNWSVDALTEDTITEPKSLSIVDLSYAADYTVASRLADEVSLANTTSGALTPPEHLRYGKQKISDVYSQFDVQPSQRLNAREGERTMSEVKFLLKATNSVSGQEVLLPFRGWICLQAPTVDFVNATALNYLLKRTIAAAFATGSTDETLAMHMAQGDLDPTA